MDYNIVSKSSVVGSEIGLLIFEEAVNKKREAGYEPIGGIAVVHDFREMKITFYQAMIKKQK